MRPRARVSMWRRLLWLLLIPLAVFSRDLWLVWQCPPRFVRPLVGVLPVALVPSGDPFELRTRAAARLVLQGRAERLVISGAGHGGDSAEILAETAYGLGLSPEQVWLEPTATNTYDNIFKSLALLDARGVEVSQLLIVTSDHHAARAGLVAERLRPQLEVFVHRAGGKRSLPMLLREASALTVYRLSRRIDLW